MSVWEMGSIWVSYCFHCFLTFNPHSLLCTKLGSIQLNIFICSLIFNRSCSRNNLFLEAGWHSVRTFAYTLHIFGRQTPWICVRLTHVGQKQDRVKVNNKDVQKISWTPHNLSNMSWFCWVINKHLKEIVDTYESLACNWRCRNVTM